MGRYSVSKAVVTGAARGLGASIAERLATGRGTGELALLPTVVSQARAWLAADWAEFQGEGHGARNPGNEGRAASAGAWRRP